MQELAKRWEPGDGQDASAALTWNLAPTQQAWTIIDTGRKPAGRRMSWGLRPTQVRPGAPKQINARAETAADKPYFRSAWRSRRCVVPADHYYEWQVAPDGKQPVLIRLTSGKPLLLAGLYEPQADDSPDGFAIVTAEAIGALSKIHRRMPAVLSQVAAWRWLDSQTPHSQLGQIVDKARDEQKFTFYQVSRLVNNVRNDGSELAQRAQVQSTLDNIEHN